MQFIQETEAAFKKDRKSPMNPMKVLSAAFSMYFWNTEKGNDAVKDYVTEIES